MGDETDFGARPTRRTRPSSSRSSKTATLQTALRRPTQQTSTTVKSGSGRTTSSSLVTSAQRARAKLRSAQPSTRQPTTQTTQTIQPTSPRGGSTTPTIPSTYQPGTLQNADVRSKGLPGDSYVTPAETDETPVQQTSPKATSSTVTEQATTAKTDLSTRRAEQAAAAAAAAATTSTTTDTGTYSSESSGGGGGGGSMDDGSGEEPFEEEEYDEEYLDEYADEYLDEYADEQAYPEDVADENPEYVEPLEEEEVITYLPPAPEGAMWVWDEDQDQWVLVPTRAGESESEGDMFNENYDDAGVELDDDEDEFGARVVLSVIDDQTDSMLSVPLSVNDTDALYDLEDDWRDDWADPDDEGDDGMDDDKPTGFSQPEEYDVPVTFPRDEIIRSDTLVHEFGAEESNSLLQNVFNTLLPEGGKNLGKDTLSPEERTARAKTLGQQVKSELPGLSDIVELIPQPAVRDRNPSWAAPDDWTNKDIKDAYTRAKKLAKEAALSPKRYGEKLALVLDDVSEANGMINQLAPGLVKTKLAQRLYEIASGLFGLASTADGRDISGYSNIAMGEVVAYIVTVNNIRFDATAAAFAWTIANTLKTLLANARDALSAESRGLPSGFERIQPVLSTTAVAGLGLAGLVTIVLLTRKKKTK